MTVASSPQSVLEFWRKAGPARWYKKDDAFDREIVQNFADIHSAAARGEVDHWADTPEGALALLLVLDQFSRNMFRGSPQTFAQDRKARRIALEAIAKGFDKTAEPDLQQFFYLPLMHSESIKDQELCVKLCHGLPGGDTLFYARDHERIIRRFGRFPHRNQVLGRFTSPAEQTFLAGGGFAG